MGGGNATRARLACTGCMKDEGPGRVVVEEQEPPAEIGRAPGERWAVAALADGGTPWLMGATHGLTRWCQANAAKGGLAASRQQASCFENPNPRMLQSRRTGLPALPFPPC